MGGAGRAGGRRVSRGQRLGASQAAVAPPCRLEVLGLGLGLGLELGLWCWAQIRVRVRIGLGLRMDQGQG